MSLAGREVTLGWQRFSSELRAAGAGNGAERLKKGVYSPGGRAGPEGT